MQVSKSKGRHFARDYRKEFEPKLRGKGHTISYLILSQLNVARISLGARGGSIRSHAAAPTRAIFHGMSPRNRVVWFPGFLVFQFDKQTSQRASTVALELEAIQLDRRPRLH